MRYIINKNYRCLVKAKDNIISISVQSRYCLILWKEIDYYQIEISRQSADEDEAAAASYPFFPNAYPMRLSTFSHAHGSYDHEIWPLNRFNLQERLKEIENGLICEEEAMRITSNEALYQLNKLS